MTLKRLAASLGIVAALVAGVAWLTDRRAAARTEAAEAAYPPEGAFVEVGGRRVHYVQRGAGPDLVLIHGAGGNARDFTFALIDKLAERYRVTAFDRPGHGYTPPAPGRVGAWVGDGESPAEQAALLVGAAERIGIDAPVVLGQSFGGAVALAWAVEHPDRLSALVSVAGVANPWPGELDRFYRVLGSRLGGAFLAPLIAAWVPDDTAADALTGIFAPQDPPEGYRGHIGVPLAIRTVTLRANARQVKGLRPHVVAISERHDTIEVPVEIVHGTADSIVPVEIHSRPLVAQVAGAVLDELDGIGHMPHHVAEEAVVAAIDRAAARAGLR